MKKLLVVLLVVLSVQTNAQVNSISLQASGLTCSMCSRSIFKALKTIDFVDNVTPDIKNSTFEISVKNGSQVDFDLIKKKVEDAGFFVANLFATVHFDKMAIKNDDHAQMNGLVLHFLNTKDQVLVGDKTIRILDKGFVTSKEYKKNSKYTLMECYKTGVAGACCAKDGLSKGTRIFHVII